MHVAKSTEEEDANHNIRDEHMQPMSGIEPPDRSALEYLLRLDRQQLKEQLENSKDKIYNICIEAYNYNPYLYPAPPNQFDCDRVNLQCMIWFWQKKLINNNDLEPTDADFEEDNHNKINKKKRRRKKQAGRLVRSESRSSDSSSDDENASRSRRKRNFKKAKRQSNTDPGRANDNRDDYYGEYEYNEQRPFREYAGRTLPAKGFRKNLTRKLLHFFLDFNKDLPTVVRDIFNDGTRSIYHSRDIGPVEVECLTLAYAIHAFLVTVPDLDASLQEKHSAGLEYLLRRLYVLYRIEVSVPDEFETKEKAWWTQKILLEEYLDPFRVASEPMEEAIRMIIRQKLDHLECIEKFAKSKESKD